MSKNNNVVSLYEQQIRADFAPSATKRSPEEIRTTLERLERHGPPDGPTPPLEDPRLINARILASLRAAKAADDGQPITDADFARAAIMSEDDFDAFACKVTVRSGTREEMVRLTRKLAEARAVRAN
jgi:hypothetical protein